MISNWNKNVTKFWIQVEMETERILLKAKEDLQTSDMLFDREFRDCFLYLTNNRIAFAYEKCLLQIRIGNQLTGAQSEQARVPNNESMQRFASMMFGNVNIGNETSTSIEAIILLPATRASQADQSPATDVNGSGQNTGDNGNGSTQNADNINRPVNSVELTNIAMPSHPIVEPIQPASTEQANTVVNEIRPLPTSTPFQDAIESSASEANNGIKIIETANRITTPDANGPESNELDDIDCVFDAPESESTNVELSNQSIVYDFVHNDDENLVEEQAAPIAQDKGTNQQVAESMNLTCEDVESPSEGRSNAQTEQSTVGQGREQRRKRKLSDASTSSGNSTKRRKANLRSTLRTIPESESEVASVDLTLNEIESPDQANSTSNQPVEDEDDILCGIKEAMTLASKANQETQNKTSRDRKRATAIRSKRHKCAFCEYVARDKTNLTNHTRIHTGEKPFKCKVCARGFTLKHHLTDHMRTHADEFPFQCSNCRQGFKQNEEKDAHEKSCNLRCRFECYLCKHIVDRKSYLVDHMRKRHTGEELFRCPYCSKRFTDKSGLDYHLTIEPKEFCNAFKRRFAIESNEWILNEARSSVQANNSTSQPAQGEGAVSCGVKELRTLASKTKQTAQNKTSSGRKSAIASGSKGHKCGFSEHVAPCKSKLETHTRIHTGEKPFKCKVCAKGFTTKQSLTKHMRTHADRFPFKCSFCRQGFNQNKEKDEHEKKCNLRRRYECYLCKNPAFSKWQLVEHMRTHTGERPFQCSHCLKGFIQKGALIKHMKIKPKELWNAFKRRSTVESSSETQ